MKPIQLDVVEELVYSILPDDIIFEEVYYVDEESMNNGYTIKFYLKNNNLKRGAVVLSKQETDNKNLYELIDYIKERVTTGVSNLKDFWEGE